MSPVGLGEVLVVFVNRFTADAKFPFKIVRICNSQFKCNNLENQKLSLKFLFHCWNIHQILNILKKKMIVTANELSKLHTVKNFNRALPNKCHS